MKHKRKHLKAFAAFFSAILLFSTEAAVFADVYKRQAHGCARADRSCRGHGSPLRAAHQNRRHQGPPFSPGRYEPHILSAADFEAPPKAPPCPLPDPEAPPDRKSVV